MPSLLIQTTNLEKDILSKKLYRKLLVLKCLEKNKKELGKKVESQREQPDLIQVQNLEKVINLINKEETNFKNKMKF